MNKKYSLKLAGCLIAGVIAFNSQASYCMEDYYYDTIEYTGNSKEIKELVNKANELQSETMSTSNSSFVPGVEEFRKESKKLNEQVRNNILNANLTWDINNDKAKVDTYIKIAKMLRNATNLASMLSDNLDPNDNTICHHFYARFVKGLFKDIKIKNSEIYKLANGKTDDFKKFNELLEGYSHRSYLYTKIGEKYLGCGVIYYSAMNFIILSLDQKSM